MEILEKKGSLTDIELHDLLKESYEDIGFGNLNKTLMKLELKGKVFVSTISKGKRLIEIKADN